MGVSPVFPVGTLPGLDWWWIWDFGDGSQSARVGKNLFRCGAWSVQAEVDHRVPLFPLPLLPTPYDTGRNPRSIGVPYAPCVSRGKPVTSAHPYFFLPRAHASGALRHQGGA